MENEVMNLMEEATEEIVPVAQAIAEETIVPAAQEVAKELPTIVTEVAKPTHKHSALKTGALAVSIIGLVVWKWNPFGKIKAKKAAEEEARINAMVDKRWNKLLAATTMAQQPAAEETEVKAEEQTESKEETK